MKSLSDYMNDKQTLLFEKTGSFFAFGMKQFQEKRKPNVQYVSVGAGLICPKNNVQELEIGLDEIYKEAVKQDIQENGIEGIIKRELGNHECYYTGNYHRCFEAVEDYPGVTIELVERIFHEETRKS